MEADAGGPIADLLATARPEQAAIRSRWQHDAVPPWRRVEPMMVCEVRVTNLDLSVVCTHVMDARTKSVCHSHSTVARRTHVVPSQVNHPSDQPLGSVSSDAQPLTDG